MRHTPDALMLFAAGKGTRMGALTAHQPKPLIPVAGKPLIDHALSLADGAGIKRIVVNTHYLPAQIARHLAARPEIALSHEADLLLETGGGLRNALPLLGDDPVLTLNSDAVWTGANPIIRLRDAWDDAQMDALLMLVPQHRALGHNGTGDFLIDENGRISRANGRAGPVYTGVQMIRTTALHSIAEPVFSLNRLWDIAIANQRAFALLHDGGWCDVGRPEGIALAESMLAQTHV